MAIGLQADAALVKAPGKYLSERCVASEDIDAGELVYLTSAGTAALAAGGAVATNYIFGVAMQDVLSGGTFDVLTEGLFEFATGATPGKIVYLSDTAGLIAETAGTKSSIVGVAKTATRIYVRPQIVALA